MSDVLCNDPLRTAAGLGSATDLAGWLADLLDAARDRQDMALARLIAAIADDHARAKLEYGGPPRNG